MGVPKIRGTLVGVPIIRTIVFWGLCWGPPILGNYHIGMQKVHGCGRSSEELQQARYCRLPPLCNSWIIHIVHLYIALNMTPNLDCYRVGAIPEQ